jgi:hypothetical protein
MAPRSVDYSRLSGAAGAATPIEFAMLRRDVTGQFGSTAHGLAAQWSSPNNVLAVLLVIGADIVQKALAQSTGTWFTPVCFSFGWVSYSFLALLNINSEGRLLPPPDYPAKVFNLKTGYCRQNQNWVVGRILRDHEQQIARKHPLKRAGIRIAIYEAMENKRKLTQFSFTTANLLGLFFMLLQLGVAAIPAGQRNDWGLLLITGAGTLLALVVGALPQWTAEKLPNRQSADKTFALTTGNGSTEVMVIIGAGRCLDLEDLAASPNPRSGRPWEKFWWLSFPQPDADDKQMSTSNKVLLRAARMKFGFPVGFWISRIVFTISCILWLALLVTVGGLESNAWLLLVIGGIGMFQNGMLAAIERDPRTRNLPLQLVNTIVTMKVMDGIMDFEVSHPGFGGSLLSEFFPGQLKKEEELWWNGRREHYDAIRFERCYTQRKRKKPSRLFIVRTRLLIAN